MRRKRYDHTGDFLDGNYNCAEVVLLWADERYGLGIPAEDVRLVSGFGGGMGCGENCGALRAWEMGERAQVWTHRLPSKSGTVYLCCADGEGNMVSGIQSNYMGFGSGILVDGTESRTDSNIACF